MFFTCTAQTYSSRYQVLYPITLLWDRTLWDRTFRPHRQTPRTPAAGKHRPPPALTPARMAAILHSGSQTVTSIPNITAHSPDQCAATNNVASELLGCDVAVSSLALAGGGERYLSDSKPHCTMLQHTAALIVMQNGCAGAHRAAVFLWGGSSPLQRPHSVVTASG